MNAATDKQIAFLLKLVEERVVPTLEAGTPELVAELMQKSEEWARRNDRKAVSAQIDRLIALPKPEKAKPVQTELPIAPKAEVNLEGMHKVGDRIFKVQVAVHGSGNLYAKELTQYGDSWKFEFARGAMRMLSVDTKMSLEEAKSFGALYGTCCVCGRTLTNETSIEEGIGPVCAGKF